MPKDKPRDLLLVAQINFLEETISSFISNKCLPFDKHVSLTNNKFQTWTGDPLEIWHQKRIFSEDTLVVRLYRTGDFL